MRKEYVVALIPNREQPPRFVIDKITGEPPIVERGPRSAESMLPDIARVALADRYYLSVDCTKHALLDQSDTTTWVFLTKPVPTVRLHAGYKWARISGV